MHCYSVSITVDGKAKEVCTLVPGNERLSKELAGGRKPTPTREEVNRALDWHLQQNHGHDSSIDTESQQPNREWREPSRGGLGDQP